MTKNDPFPDWPAPSADACQDIVERLAMLHGYPERAEPQRVSETTDCGSVPTILDALIRTILSQNTTNRNSGRAMRNLLETFASDYTRVRLAPIEKVAKAIACGGLGNIKARRIKALLAEIFAQTGQLSLEHLRFLPDDQVKEALLAYKGVGPKTASCVLLFCLGRDSFAVDTHIYRIAKKLGWVPLRATREQTHSHLDQRIPKRLHHPLHVLMIRHGRSCYECAANGRPQQKPRGPCPMPVSRQVNKCEAAAAGRFPASESVAGRCNPSPVV